MEARLLIDCRDAHGEGALWSTEHGLFMWSDITGARIHHYDPLTKAHQTFRAPGEIGSFAPRAGRPATEIVAAVKEGFAFINLAAGTRRDLHSIDPGKPHIRMNDGRTDRAGGFIAGGYDESGNDPTASVWRLGADLSLTRLFGGVGCANGTCFAADGRTLYFADSNKGELEAFDYDSGGTPTRRRAIARTPAPGVPDGSCIDAEGFIWNAVWEGYRIERWSPDGRLDRVVRVPVKKPTCLAFGGANLDLLLITTSRLMETAEDLAREPTAGSVYLAEPGVRGIADRPFAG